MSEISLSDLKIIIEECGRDLTAIQNCIDRKKKSTLVSDSLALHQLNLDKHETENLYSKASSMYEDKLIELTNKILKS